MTLRTQTVAAWWEVVTKASERLRDKLERFPTSGEIEWLGADIESIARCVRDRHDPQQEVTCATRIAH